MKDSGTMFNRMWNCIRSAIGELVYSLKPRRARRSRRIYATTLYAESLEDRQLLSTTQITFDNSTSAIVIQGSSLADNVELYVDAANRVQVSIQNANETIYNAFPRSSVAQIRFLGGDGGDRFANSTNILAYAWGEGGDDLLIGGTGQNHFSGGAGDDELIGNVAYDNFYGDDGNDILSGSFGGDLLIGGRGDDELYGGDGDDSMYGQDGADKLFGHDGIDRLFGDAGNDYIEGGLGDDWIYGGADNDELLGNAGRDKVYGDLGDDLIKGDDGNDVLVGGVGNDFMQGGIGDDWLLGDDGDDTIHGDEGSDWIFGVRGNDRLEGGAGNDLVAGGDGDDAVIGDDGDDTLYGQDGNDWMHGGAGNDVLGGGRDNDNLVGGDGNDKLAGFDGNDVLYGEAGNDLLYGDIGSDRLEGGVGENILWGGTGDDHLVVNGDNNILFGEDGNDRLVAGAGHDVLVGGAGDDVLLPSDGNDILIGGAGQDEFHGALGHDILIGGTTTYDEDPDKLKVLAAAWSTATPYASRIQLIEDESFEAYLQSELTVFDDQVSDVLYGGENQDWFILTGYLGTYKPESDHSHEHNHEETGAGDNSAAHGHAQTILDHPPELEGYELIDSLDVLLHRQANEAIHSLMPHADNPVLQREHLTLFELVRYDQLTHIAMHSGRWSDPATWQNGVVPGNGARVLIPIGVEVKVDAVVPTRVATIRVDGILSFDGTRNTQLAVDTLVVSGTGAFEMGTAEAPIARGVTARLLITDNGAIDRSWDPFGISRGLISHGRVSIYGAALTSYASLGGVITAGTTSLTLKESPLGWKVGDTIVIAGTTTGSAQNEVRTVAAIFGKVVVLNQPLNYNHLAPSVDLEVHVANVTRNAVIESEANATDRRGHVMFMHNRNVDIQFAGFYRLGRTDKLEPISDSVVQSDWTLKAGTGTNQRGRYAVHFHRNGLVNDGNPSTVVGSAVVDSPGWGFVNHSGYVDFTANVAFDVSGAAFATEVGDEIGGFYSNLAIGSTGSGEEINAREMLQDFGHQGDGFWFQGGGVSVVGNASAGNEGSAFVYYTRGLIESAGRATFPTMNLSDPSIAGGAASIAVGLVPVTNFRDNSGYASTNGLKVRYNLENATHGANSVFEDSTFWNNTNGVYLHYAQNSVLRDLTVTQAASTAVTAGIRQNGITGHIVYDHLNIIGYHIGLEIPRWGNNIVNGGNLQNTYDIALVSAIFFDRSVLITGFTTAPRILMFEDLAPIVNSTVATYFVRDTLVLNFGSFVSRQFYFTGHRASSVPFPTARPDIPSQYVGLTNQQLWDRFGVALGGQMAPSTAVTVPFITGGIVALPL